MIIFLDIDGVLNNTSMDFDSDEIKSQGIWFIDPKNLEVFEDMVRRLDASIVISSTWRITNTREFFKDHLGDYLYSRLHEDWATKRLGSIRGLEVREWIERNIPDQWKFKDYLILDDDQDFLWYQPLILVPHNKGLTSEIVDVAIASRGVRKYDV